MLVKNQITTRCLKSFSINNCTTKNHFTKYQHFTVKITAKMIGLQCLHVSASYLSPQQTQALA